MDDLEALVKILELYGPWALVALLSGALGWLGRMYVQVRDRHTDQLLGLTERSISATLQASDNFLDIQKALERIERKRSEE